MFSIDDRNRAREHVLELASADPRVVAAAVVGSLAHGEVDRWSDVDLTFAVAEGVPVVDVLSDWTRDLAEELDAVRLFDLPSGATIYRVFLLPGCLQVDLSFTPVASFGARGPKFSLLFGTVVEIAHPPPPSADELFGLAVHHAVRARICIIRPATSGHVRIERSCFAPWPVRLPGCFASRPRLECWVRRSNLGCDSSRRPDYSAVGVCGIAR